MFLFIYFLSLALALLLSTRKKNKTKTTYTVTHVMSYINVIFKKNNNSALALKAATLMPILLLQKPSRKSKQKDHTSCLTRPDELLREGRTIQHRIRITPPLKKEQLPRNLMLQGKTKAALRLLSEKEIVTTSDGQ